MTKQSENISPREKVDSIHLEETKMKLRNLKDELRGSEDTANIEKPDRSIDTTMQLSELAEKVEADQQVDELRMPENQILSHTKENATILEPDTILSPTPDAYIINENNAFLWKDTSTTTIGKKPIQDITNISTGLVESGIVASSYIWKGVRDIFTLPRDIIAMNKKESIEK